MILTMFRATSSSKLFEIFKVSKVVLEKSGYDNWNGGTDIYDINVSVPAETYFINKTEIEASSQSICDLVKNVFDSMGNFWVGRINFIPNAPLKNIIGEYTRKLIFDHIQTEGINWSGSLTHPEFLSRIFNLKAMKSTDGRYSDAEGDIYKHTVNNDDWEPYWVFTDRRFDLLNVEDETFLTFLSEMVHPIVRGNPQESERLVQIFNTYLGADGYEVFPHTNISGRNIYSGRLKTTHFPSSISPAKEIIQKMDDEYMSRQITRLESAVSHDPDLAIGTAKELVETCCKTILDERKVAFGKDDTIIQLVKSTCKELKLTPNDISETATASETIKKILGNFAAITQGLTELRNQYGTGHGKTRKAKGLSSRHAKLAAGAATTLAIFLFETHKEKVDTGKPEKITS